MTGAFSSKSKSAEKKLAAQQTELQRKSRETDAELERLKTPAPMPDEADEKARRAKMRAATKMAEEGGASETTTLTGSRLGDASAAVARRGRIKSAVMTGGA
jgi:hypothetical protein